jgi:hypothetical protein
MLAFRTMFMHEKSEEDEEKGKSYRELKNVFIMKKKGN